MKVEIEKVEEARVKHRAAVVATGAIIATSEGCYALNTAGGWLVLDTPGLIMLTADTITGTRLPPGTVVKLTVE